MLWNQILDIDIQDKWFYRQTLKMWWSSLQMFNAGNLLKLLQQITDVRFHLGIWLQSVCNGKPKTCQRKSANLVINADILCLIIFWLHPNMPFWSPSKSLEFVSFKRPPPQHCLLRDGRHVAGHEKNPHQPHSDGYKFFSRFIQLEPQCIQLKLSFPENSLTSDQQGVRIVHSELCNKYQHGGIIPFKL